MENLKMTCQFKQHEKNTLFVGLVCLDIVAVVDKFPEEDVDKPCEECRWQRGGNAGNSAVVVSILGGKSAVMGTLSDSSQTDFLTTDLKKNGVAFDKCVIVQETSCPTSVVILNKNGGTRTILHNNKNLRELTVDDFIDKINLESSEFGWIHFEGRDNAAEIFKMLSYVNDFNKKHREGNSFSRVITSLEAEKIRFATGMDGFDLWSLPDVLFVSKDFARSQGYHDMKTAVNAYSHKTKKEAAVICAWGEEGAAAMSAGEGLVVSPAFPPGKIVDTCGAGDTFNGAVIRALSEGRNLYDSVRFGCFVAGAKFGFQGFDDMKQMELLLKF